MMKTATGSRTMLLRPAGGNSRTPVQSNVVHVRVSETHPDRSMLHMKNSLADKLFWHFWVMEEGYEYA